MKKTLKKLCLIALLFLSMPVLGQVTDRTLPPEWKNLVEGGRFMDRFEAMPKGKLVYDTWGATNVIPRYQDNGLEYPHLSFWGGNILEKDGKFHAFICGWLESKPKGHMEWPNSIVYRSVSDNLHGPYQIVDTIGPGHNPEAFRMDDGRVVLTVTGAYYIADDLEGPWTKSRFKYDTRNRPIIEGLSNKTYAKRQDGSVLMVCRGGGSWISRDGIDPYEQITVKRIYPDVAGEFEDPVVWKDSLQYHLIVNDWMGRIAYYQRSLDGVHWVTEEGEAYALGIAKHEDGYLEDWYKYERIKVFQDEAGRVVQTNFAVIDTIKWEDFGSDNHSSKNICIPMNKGVLLEIENEDPITAQTKEIRLRIKGEKGFKPAKDLDIASLRLGNFTEVNYGRGSKPISSKKAGKDLIVIFDGQGSGITADEFAPKLLGKSKAGKMVYGYAKLPYLNYKPAILSSKKPVVVSNTLELEVENFGLSKSDPAEVKVYSDDTLVATSRLKALAPYEKTTIILGTQGTLEKETSFRVEFFVQDKLYDTNNFK